MHHSRMGQTWCTSQSHRRLLSSRRTQAARGLYLYHTHLSTIRAEVSRLRRIRAPCSTNPTDSNLVSYSLRLLEAACLHLSHYILALSPSAIHLLTNSHVTSPIAPIFPPCSLAIALLACLRAHLALIPWIITHNLYKLNASPHASSNGVGVHRATSLYHSTHWARVGRPGVWFGTKAVEAEPAPGEVEAERVRMARGEEEVT